RVTGMQQIDEVVVRAWDPVASKTIEATANVGQLGSKIGITRDSIVGAVGKGTVTGADRPLFSDAEAQELAKSLASYLGNAYVEAEGTSKGNPKLRAGSKIKIDGIGARYGGTFTVSATTHIFRGAQGYQTAFSVSGRTSRTLVDLMTPAAQRQ